MQIDWLPRREGGIISRQQNTGFTVQHAIWYDLSDRVRSVCRTQAEQRSYIRDKKRAWRARAPEVDNPTPRQHEARGDISQYISMARLSRLGRLAWLVTQAAHLKCLFVQRW